ncbi:hypothetical protein BH10PSE4_BH10PSE4_16500 [soil metagenome]
MIKGKKRVGTLNVTRATSAERPRPDDAPMKSVATDVMSAIASPTRRVPIAFQDVASLGAE